PPFMKPPRIYGRPAQRPVKHWPQAPAARPMDRASGATTASAAAAQKPQTGFMRMAATRLAIAAAPAARLLARRFVAARRLAARFVARLAAGLLDSLGLLRPALGMLAARPGLALPCRLACGLTRCAACLLVAGFARTRPA